MPESESLGNRGESTLPKPSINMGVAYYIVLDNEDPGFDTMVNGKAVARAREEIYVITDALKIKGIDDLTDFGAWEEEFDVAENDRAVETPWFEPKVGLEWVTAVRQAVEGTPSSHSEPDRLIEDLKEYEAVLRNAEKIGARWHFEMDL
jgi:hypothetical protein